MASRSSRRPRSVRSARPSRDASSDVSSAASASYASETDVSVSSSVSSLDQPPHVGKHAKRGAGRKSRSNTSVKSAQSKGSGLRRSSRLALKKKPAGFYARVPDIDGEQPRRGGGSRKHKVSTRSPKRSAPVSAHHRSTGSKKRSPHPRK